MSVVTKPPSKESPGGLAANKKRHSLENVVARKLSLYIIEHIVLARKRTSAYFRCTDKKRTKLRYTKNLAAPQNE